MNGTWVHKFYVQNDEKEKKKNTEANIIGFGHHRWFLGLKF